MNCKPGDLAVIIRTKSPNKANVGKIVKVIDRYLDDKFFGYSTDQSMVWWWVESAGSDLLLQNARGTDILGFVKSRPMKDCSLHPIRGLEKTEEQTNQVKEPA